MTKNILLLFSLWAGLSKEVREAIEYSVRQGKTMCELWVSDDLETIKTLQKLGFEIEVITKEGIVKRYITISWKNLKED